MPIDVSQTSFGSRPLLDNPLFCACAWVYDLLITIKITTVSLTWPIPPSSLPLPSPFSAALRYLTFTRPFSFTTKGRHGKSARRQPYLIQVEYSSTGSMVDILKRCTESFRAFDLSSRNTTLYNLHQRKVFHDPGGRALSKNGVWTMRELWIQQLTNEPRDVAYGGGEIERWCSANDWDELLRFLRRQELRDAPDGEGELS